MHEHREEIATIQRLIDEAKALDAPQTEDEARQRMQNLLSEVAHIIMQAVVGDAVKKVLEAKIAELIVEGKLTEGLGGTEQSMTDDKPDYVGPLQEIRDAMREKTGPRSEMLQVWDARKATPAFYTPPGGEPTEGVVAVGVPGFMLFWDASKQSAAKVSIELVEAQRVQLLGLDDSTLLPE